MQYDAFVFKKDTNEYLLDCDARIVGDFIYYLKQYKLRSKIDIEDVSSNMSIVAGWNHPGGIPSGLQVADKRCDWRMLRSCILKKESTMAVSSDTTIYDALRTIKGIPEGPVEIARGKAIPMESNMDLMGAIDLHKGCYLGQELITRTLHRGVVRKRVVPIQLFDWNRPRDDFEANPTHHYSGTDSQADLMPVEPQSAKVFADVTRIDSEHPFGRIVRMLGNIGLALVRLEEMPSDGLFALHRPTPSIGSPTFILGRASVPSWWPENIRFV